MSNIKSFCNRLKNLCAENNLLQKDLAEILGLAQTTIANYEQGKRFPNEETLLKIADFFNVSTDYLFGRSEIKSCNENFSLRDSMQLSKRSNGYSSNADGAVKIANKFMLNRVLE